MIILIIRWFISFNQLISRNIHPSFREMRRIYKNINGTIIFINIIPNKTNITLDVYSHNYLVFRIKILE